MVQEFTYNEMTNNVLVEVFPHYIPEKSRPDLSVYFFAYTIRIHNLGAGPVKLLKRFWIIRDANKHEETVFGEGVVGVQPVILPNDFYEYTSFCPLKTTSGSMRGRFDMIDHEDRPFSVTIPLFFLRADLH